MKNQTRVFVSVVLTLLQLGLAGCASKLTPPPAPANGAAATPGETRAERDARMKWWREAKFGMFIHWGLYAVPAGTYHDRQIPGIGEWIMNNADIPMAEYATYATHFNPTNFDADAWAALAKAAGMKYMVITSKHHDGFAMFHSQTSPFNIYDATPFKRDPVAELAVACKKQGIKFGVYYSQSQDWNHPGGAEARRNGRTNDYWDPGQVGSYDDYLRHIAVPQVQELLTRYPISVLWWDTPMHTTPTQAALFAPLLKLRPGLITNNRLGGSVQGDTETPEQRIPANGFKDRDWETCMTINDTWGYKSYDLNFKSTQKLIENLIDISSKGGNFLLNVGPTADGIIPVPEAGRLREMGAWLKTNGEAIYGTQASPFTNRLSWGRVTQKPGKLYLEVFNWPDNGLLTVPILNKNVQASFLAQPRQKLVCQSTARGLEIYVPAAAPDPIASVIVLRISGNIELAAP